MEEKEEEADLADITILAFLLGVLEGGHTVGVRHVRRRREARRRRPGRASSRSGGVRRGRSDGEEGHGD